MKSKKTIIVDSASNGVRLDKFLKEKLNIPFSLLHKELRKKSIEVNNKKKLGSYRVKQDDIVDVLSQVLPIAIDNTQTPISTKNPALLTKINSLKTKTENILSTKVKTQ